MWEKLIETDRIRSVSEDFSSRGQQKIHIRKSDELSFKKRHLWVSVAAGIIVGVLILNLQHRIHPQKERMEQIQEWLGQYNFNDLNLEKLDKNLF